MKKTSSGFTIVELLIVIVVIGILATIAIVAYNGIQKRANDTKRKDDIAKITKGLVLWSHSTGSTFEAMNSGNGYPATGWFSANYGGGAVKTVLINSGYLNDGVKEPAYSGSRDYMLTPCTDATDNRRVVMARLDDAPSQTLTQQISPSACNHSHINIYVSTYLMNYAVIADAR